MLFNNRFSSYSFSSKINSKISQFSREISQDDFSFIKSSRLAISDIISGRDDRVMVILGPCSIHCIDSAIEYAEKLSGLKELYQDKIMLVMRVYFEKSRTNFGWKGLLLQPHLNDKFDFQRGFSLLQDLLMRITAMKIPIATELINPYHFDFFKDFISWGVVGARSVESQLHRELVSGFDFPMAFKNRTDGDLDVAVNAISTASRSNSIYLHDDGDLYSLLTTGNLDSHLVLRGGLKPNYYVEDVLLAKKKMQQQKLHSKILIDCSHGNSGKSCVRQLAVAEEIAMQFNSYSGAVCGLMLESFLESGRQDIGDLASLNYGQSVTDECLSFATTANLLDLIYKNI